MNAVIKALAVCRGGIKSRARSWLRQGVVGSGAHGTSPTTSRGGQCVRISMVRRQGGRFRDRIAWSEAGGHLCSSVNGLDASMAQSLGDQDQASVVARTLCLR